MRVKEIDTNVQTTMCAECTSNNVVAIEFTRRREHEPSISTTFVKLFVLHYKRARQSRQQSVKTQTALCEVACKENGGDYTDLTNRCCCLRKGCKQRRLRLIIVVYVV